MKPPSKLPSRSAKPALDRIDLPILEALRQNGRITYQALSERVGLSPRPCLERVRRLEQKGVIRGYTALVEPSALGHDIIALAGISMRDPRPPRGSAWSGPSAAQSVRGRAAGRERGVRLYRPDRGADPWRPMKP